MNLGLIGKSLSYSFSKPFFEKKFKELSLNCYSYENLEFESEEDLEEEFESLKHRYSGLNVTIPYKKSVILLVDEIDDVAEKIGAINCLKFSNGASYGYNTDYLGFYHSIVDYDLDKSKKSLVIGHGGASQAIIYVLAEIMDFEIDILDRKNEDVWSQREKLDLSAYSIIVNTTPVGTSPNINECIDLSYSSICPGTLCIDLIYNPQITLFLQNCKSNGGQILNGQEMLEIQAEESWKIWNS